MAETQTGQVSAQAARVYERVFVPALFAQWPPRLLDAAAVGSGDRVLDVACGTGVLARAAVDRTGSPSNVAGIDVNEGMLSVAREAEPRVAWRHGAAEAIPFPDGSFDAAVSQFGLMFFDDRVRAIREMWRVLRPGGRMAMAVWAGLEASPGYAALGNLLADTLGDELADGLRAPFVLGAPDAVGSLFAEADIGMARLETVQGRAVFPSLAEWLHTEVRGWTFSDAVGEAELEELVSVAGRKLAAFVLPNGRVEFPVSAHIITARRDG